ncbi:MAG: hypothetical protein KGL51_08340 [Betaproteobacteria bacterium]|nr:hypothetical protein [Betaproteobacteria bacterium]MDE2124895.1 hypothetical protein [Betaproteobacteria bacterium]MDE2187838.1 hypothetical protein [Betaproteobacteria bacterium]MDE2324663.1 hypothetical protein [Betaproteobacteria bacterium]
MTYEKTDAGRQTLANRQSDLPRPLRTLLLLVDGARSEAELLGMLGGNGLDSQAFASLLERGLIRAVPTPTSAAAAPPSAPADGADARAPKPTPTSTPAAAPEPKPAPRLTAFAKLGQGLRAALESRSDSPREISAGLAEIIKCAAIADPELFAWLERHVDDLRTQQQHAVAHAVQRIQQLRDQIEVEDRQLQRSPSPLEFGMALGHVVESVLGFGRYLHGEAIGLGMLLAADLGQSLGLQSAESAERLRRLLQGAGLPMSPPRAPLDRWLELLPLDGATGAQHMRCVLLRELGAPLNQTVPREQVLRTLERSGALSA